MSFRLRQGVLDDAEAIYALVSAHVGRNRLLPRTLSNIRKTIDNWVVAEEGSRLVGCGSLTPYGQELCEVRSLVVDDAFRGNGLGRKIVHALIEMAYERGFEKVFTLTTVTDFFKRVGFVVTPRRHFPLKIYRDCLMCPAKFHCDEVTMVYRPDKDAA